jgi:hypothetical protein
MDPCCPLHNQLGLEAAAVSTLPFPSLPPSQPPRYFLLSAACNVIALGSLLVSGTTSPATTKAAASLGLALACTLGNMYYVEPREWAWNQIKCGTCGAVA